MPELTEDTYRELKRSVEDAKNEAQRAQGAFETLTKRLKDEFGCKDMKEAKARLAELEEEVRTTEKDFNKAMKAYEEKWKQ